MEITFDKTQRIETTWFKHWFDTAFYQKLYANRDENEAAAFIDELIGSIQPDRGSEMLDLGCGNGRHSKRLAAKGFSVTGLDLSASSIRIAKKSESPDLHFFRHDMRVAFGKNCFDYVFNLFTSFGYFKTQEEDHRVIENISAALRPGGILVMDYINSEPADNKMVPAETREIDGIIYRISRWSDQGHFFKKIVIDGLETGQPVEFIEQVAKFSLSDFEELFCAHGLELQQVFGDYDLDIYEPETSPRLILIAKKIN